MGQNNGSPQDLQKKNSNLRPPSVLKEQWDTNRTDRSCTNNQGRVSGFEVSFLDSMPSNRKGFHHSADIHWISNQ